MLFPMYTVPFGTFLEMTMIEPHEELKARGVLVEFQMNMGNAAFVSHQWVASSPDPEWQMKVLQVKGPNDLQLISGAGASITAGSGPVGEGAFTVPEDRLKLGPVLMKAIKRKLLSLLKAQNGFRTIGEMDSAGFSPLHYAALNGDPALIQDLLTLQADPNRDPNQVTRKVHPGAPLIQILWARLRWKVLPALDLLKPWTNSFDTATSVHWMPLAPFALLHQALEVQRILNKILYHAKGATPLMLALLSGNDEFAAALIAAGARLNLQNSRGLTAADLIRMRSGLEFLLAKHGVLVSPELLKASCGEAHLMDPKETLQHMSVSPSGRYVIAVSEKFFWRWSVREEAPEDVEMFDLEELDASQELRYVQETCPDRVLMVGEREVTDVLLFCGDSGTRRRIVKLVVTQHLKFQSPIRCQPKTPDAFLALCTATEPQGQVDLLLRAEKGNAITSLVARRLEDVSTGTALSTISQERDSSLDNGMAPTGAEPSAMEAGYPPGLPMPRYSRPPGLPSPPNRMMQEPPGLSNPMVSFDVPPGAGTGFEKIPMRMIFPESSI
ncbi:unnamed protein product [Cladocopium goreaui]|uniref:Uncharacterized protein n=1 Tax=Cladocopium goreaui TaxID=2562237 RepID=A0A9P1CZS4_9DINO|nr:unnamed protein product [Cladocopium goreaui]